MKQAKWESSIHFKHWREFWAIMQTHNQNTLCTLTISSPSTFMRFLSILSSFFSSWRHFNRDSNSTMKKWIVTLCDGACKHVSVCMCVCIIIQSHTNTLTLLGQFSWAGQDGDIEGLVIILSNLAWGKLLGGSSAHCQGTLSLLHVFLGCHLCQVCLWFQPLLVISLARKYCLLKDN